MAAVQKKKPTLEQQISEDGIRFLGKHVSREKALALMAVTTLACAIPMILGVTRWEQIPQLVTTGLVGVDGKDDSLPRWAVVFAVPGLMCLLNVIVHGQFLLHQAQMKVPPKQIRVIGRWGIPIVGTFLSTAVIQSAAGEAVLPLAFAVSCILSLAMMLLGGHLWDCPTDSAISLKHAFTGTVQEGDLWKSVHRIAAVLWLAAGLAALLDTILHGRLSVMGVIIPLAALILPGLRAKKGV